MGVLFNRRFNKRVVDEVFTEALLDKRSLAYVSGLLQMAYELGVISKNEKEKYLLEITNKQEE